MYVTGTEKFPFFTDELKLTLTAGKVLWGCTPDLGIRGGHKF